MRETDTDATANIRDARPADLPRLIAMVRALATHHGDIPKVNAAALRRDVFGSPPWLYVLVAEVEGDVAAYTSLCPLTQLQTGRRGIDMHHLFVDQRFRGTGIGRQLIESAKQKALALSCTYMMVGTHPDNADAQAVYRACGFERHDATHPRFYISLDT